jgi:hypothetical protein
MPFSIFLPSPSFIYGHTIVFFMTFKYQLFLKDLLGFASVHE